MDCSPPGSSVYGIFQAGELEWVAISFFRGSSWPRDGTWVSCIAGRHFTFWATREVLMVLWFSHRIVIYFVLAYKNKAWGKVNCKYSIWYWEMEPQGIRLEGIKENEPKNEGKQIHVVCSWISQNITRKHIWLFVCMWLLPRSLQNSPQGRNGEETICWILPVSCLSWSSFPISG